MKSQTVLHLKKLFDIWTRHQKINEE